MFKPVRTTAPSVRAVLFEEADQWLRLDGDLDQKTLVEALIDAATAHLDGWSGILGRCLVNQGWTVSFCAWPTCRILRLPFPDVSAVTVKYSDDNNDEQEVAGASVALLSDGQGSYIRFSDDHSFPSLYSDRGDPVRVVLTAGYGAAGSAVPAPLRTAILLTVAHHYRNREAVGDGSLAELPFGAAALIAPYRFIGV